MERMERMFSAKKSVPSVPSVFEKTVFAKIEDNLSRYASRFERAVTMEDLFQKEQHFSSCE